MKKTDTTKRAQEKRKGFTKKIGNTPYDYHSITANKAGEAFIY